MRHIVGGRAEDRNAASTSQAGRFETGVLTHPDNLEALMNMPGQWVDLIQQRRPIKKLILDMDSSVSETYGKQERYASSRRHRRGRHRYDQAIRKTTFQTRKEPCCRSA